MALYSIPESREHWVGLYRSTLERGALHRGRAAEPAARALELAGRGDRKRVRACGVVRGDRRPRRVPAGAGPEVLAGAKHGATVAFLVVAAALVRHGAE